MKPIDCEVGIVGAGVAGLTTAATLKKAGVDVHCLEATDRVGGRILTVHDPCSPLPIELGAEFVHGCPPEIWELINTQNLTVYEHSSRALYMLNGKCTKDAEVGDASDEVMSQMVKSGRSSDESFEDFLRRSRFSADKKNWARIQVEGFNAAPSESISVGSLIRETNAAAQIDGDRAFKILNGYDSIPLLLLRMIPDHQSVIGLNSVVEQVRWRPDRVEVGFRSALNQEKSILRCRQLVITVSLGVLRASASGTGPIQFDPKPSRALKAACSLRSGHVYRVTLRFREAFWQDDEPFKTAGFLLSQDKRFFAWWTMYPVSAPLLTAWMAGSAAEQFDAPNAPTVATEAVASLTRILGRKIPQPEAVYFHDWMRDPYFRGAYSYVPVGARGTRESLAKPESDTLFFAGEAANTNGHGATVHGAIASGEQAASLILNGKS